MPESPVRELRLALRVADHEGAVAFYRDALGLPVLETFEGGVVLDAGRATLELLTDAEAARVDEIEGGASGPIRLALEVADAETAAERLADAGAHYVADPVTTPWGHRNVRLQAPDGLQLTLFTP